MTRHGWIEKRSGARGIVYRVRYWIDAPDGGSVAKSATFSEATHGSKAAAEQAARLHLSKMIVAIADGTYIEPALLTLAQLVELWLGSKASSISAGTMRNYRSTVDRLPPETAAIQIQKLKPMHLQAMIERIRAAGVGASRIHTLFMILNAALEQGVRWELLHRNPAAAVATPAYAPPAARHWTPAQCAVFLDLEGGSVPWGVLWRLAIGTGMRRGELLALRWSDIDYAQGTISIARTLKRGGKGVREHIGETPKTRNSRRVIPLPASCVTPLKTHRKWQLAQRVAAAAWSPGPGEDDLIFTNASGQALHSSSVASRFDLAVASSGLPTISLHGLRHSFATALMLSGVSPKVAADILGDSVMTVMRIYSHVTSDARGSAVQAFDDLLGGLGTAQSVYDANTT